jgi:hypothetical protein
MRKNMQKRIRYDGKTVLAVIIPEHRQNGMYYEVNIKGFPTLLYDMVGHWAL